GMQGHGRVPSDSSVARLVGAVIIVLGALVSWAGVSAIGDSSSAQRLVPSIPAALAMIVARWPRWIGGALLLLVAFGHALPALGGVGGLGAAARGPAPARITNPPR